MTALSGSYYCDRCQAGYVRRLAKSQEYTCLCGGHLTLGPLAYERDRVKQLRAELAAAQVEIRALRAAVQWAGTHARRVRGDTHKALVLCEQLAASDELLAEMRRTA